MRKVSAGIKAIKQVPFFGTIKTVLFLAAVGGIVMVVLIFRQALYGERDTHFTSFEGAKFDDSKIYLGKEEEKVWYWESYFEQSTGKLSDSIVGFKIGRRF